ncbi:hypothetical protein, partial [Echinicola rosea]|uniref:hypothetical protein n=1 Tax=Echinicola rosea TaxID=1807691 RepID=UPI001E61ECE5
LLLAQVFTNTFVPWRLSGFLFLPQRHEDSKGILGTTLLLLAPVFTTPLCLGDLVASFFCHKNPKTP